MSLKLILGRSGQGKTRYMTREVIRRSEMEPSRQFYVIVPEQFSLEMQRNIVKHHPRQGFFNVDVMSFYRMAYRIFDELQYQPRDILEDLGVSMVLRKIMAEHEEEFPYFKKSMKKPGFLDELKSALIEFLCYEITWEQVQEIPEKAKEHPRLGEKCRELGKIYEYFEDAMAGRFMVTEQILDVLCELLPKSKLLKNAIFYFDGFTGFTPVQLHFLKELLSYAGQVNVAVTIPARQGMPMAQSEELFYFSEKTVRSLLHICREAGAMAEDPILLEKEGASRFMDNAELGFLEENLFRAAAGTFEKEPEHVHVTFCRNPEAEAEYILHKIEWMVRKKGYRYRDFAVLTGNMEQYASAFERKAQILKIPLFEDMKKKVSYHPGLETVRALFYLSQMNYSYESVFRYLKSGMSGLADEDVDYLENYVLSAGIRGYSMWKKPFSRRVSRMAEEQRKYLDKLRTDFLAETEDFHLIWRDGKQTVKAKMKALYEAMCRLEYDRKLKEMADLAGADGDYVREKECQQLFSLLVRLLDKIADIFGEECLPGKELAKIADAGLDALGLGVAPLSMDQLIFGDLKRTRLPEIKILFIAGMNEGNIPPSLEERGILKDDEKNILKGYGITLSHGRLEQSMEDDFYMYLAFCRPTEEIFFTGSALAKDGKALRPSPALNDLRRMFPRLSVKTYPEEEPRWYFNVEDSREYLIDGLKRMEKTGYGKTEPPAYRMLLGYWLENRGLREDVKRYWEEQGGKAEFPALNRDVAADLFGRELKGSVTRLETFAACPYQYYCIYGLGLSEREEYKIRPVDMGNLFHKALEIFSRELKESEYTWKNVPENVVEALAGRAVDKAADENVMDVLQGTARNRYKYRTVRRILRRTIDMIRLHLKNSRLEPDRFELHFGRADHLEAADIPLSEGNRMYLEGFVDRIDICEEEDAVLMRVIDYKSGIKKFDINDFYYGLQLQLVIYMSAAAEIYQREKNKTVVPAGIYYYHLKDPIFRMDPGEKDKMIRSFRMSGYTNDSTDILDKIEAEESNFVSAQVRLTRNGIPYKTSSVMKTEDFQMLRNYARQKAREIGEEIYSGNIEAKPGKNGKDTACDFCPYFSVCGFDPAFPGYRYQEYHRKPPEEILDVIRKQVE